MLSWPRAKMQIMNKQKFYNINLVYDFDHLLDRGLLESWLQHFFATDLKGKDLAGLVGDVEIHVRESARPRNSYEWVSPTEVINDKADRVQWWTEQYVVTRMVLRERDKVNIKR